MNKYVVGQGKIFTGCFVDRNTGEICITVVNNPSDIEFKPGQVPTEEENKILKEKLKSGNIPVTIFSFLNIDHAIKFVSGFYTDEVDISDKIQKIRNKYNMYLYILSKKSK